MKLLLDTHTFLWLLDSPEKLSDRARDACQKPEHEIPLSTVSAWEIQIKAQLGKLTLGEPLAHIVAQQQADNGLQVLEITLPHVLAVNDLPLHHKDPFDRLLMAQSRVEKLHLVTADEQIGQYPVETYW